MDAKLKADWVKALRSGEYEQTRCALADDGFQAFCCIGVGYKVCIGPVEALDNAALDRTESAALALGIPSNFQTDLIRMNDAEEKSFPEIADYIEANL